MQWAFGVTTVPARYSTTLPRTLDSLAAAGFADPHLFVDGEPGELPAYLRTYAHTCRSTPARTAGNWYLAMMELYIRYPDADRYAVFQDDCIANKNLRDYLDEIVLEDKTYWNLYTFPHNLKDRQGFNNSDQMGKGALGLVFSNDGVRDLLTCRRFVNRFEDSDKGHQSVDGAIIASMQRKGYKEKVHNPSLLFHIGDKSTMGHGVFEPAASFLGEEYDAKELLAKTEQPRVSKRKMRIGLVGYNCPSGLGELNRQIATHIEIDRWLVKPHAHYTDLDPHPEVDTVVCRNGGKKVLDFVKSVDVILFCETPYYHDLMKYARQYKKRVVCVPMMEWLPHRGWPDEVNLFICPTKQCHKALMKHFPTALFPWPVDLERYKYRQRQTCNKFLYIHGHGGWCGRKGGDVVMKAKELWPEMPLIVHSQHPMNWPAGTEYCGAAEDNADLFLQGDVLLAPHCVDGIGLEPMEAMACGIPVVTTDAEPWNELPAIRRVRVDSTEKKKVGRLVDWRHPSPEHLVEICKELLGTDLVGPSTEARDWAELARWPSYVQEFTELVRTGQHRKTIPCAIPEQAREKYQ